MDERRERTQYLQYASASRVRIIMPDSNTTVFCPVYYQIIQRRDNGWAFKYSEPFLNLFNAPNLSPEEEFKAFGTSMKKVVIELFRINGGKQGYYAIE
ncbi:MAG: hypothetical protein QNJ49_16835 [Mastigocoleus sp. MO_167.B18]|uniref:hypothetical protein n=1 Tax=Mastigocoleus sp. MO_188.B34 TaxID=3036635 RepID=UPI0026349AF6|nr:hypothetical protein [Mastigocoleus sp. MO_188.B34]MDJ0696731.1 hypothetical protein [Mastigocoleus sp. MO_188.B34]MDJ0775064.1 hypothetical protein [Mastigocoleus sp. MO_167.B18]